LACSVAWRAYRLRGVRPCLFAFSRGATVIASLEAGRLTRSHSRRVPPRLGFRAGTAREPRACAHSRLLWRGGSCRATRYAGNGRPLDDARGRCGGGYLISGAFPSSTRSGAPTTQVVCLLRRCLLRRLRHRSSVVVPARVPGNRVDLDSTFPARSEHHPGSGWDRDPALSPLRDRPPKYLNSGQRTLPSWSLRPAPGRWLRSRLPRPGPSRPRRSP
jgi:hypothetical protein